MKINPKRIVDRLGQHGFQLAYFDEGWSQFVSIRKQAPELFSGISIRQGWERGGKLGDIVSASVRCAISPGRTALKGMAEVKCLFEVASDRETGSTTLVGAEDALQWEAKLIAIAPSRAAAFADQVGEELLSKTSEARTAAKKYLERCQSAGSTTEEMLSRLKSQADENQLREAKRILGQSIIWNENQQVFYEIAALAISLFVGEVEGDEKWLVGREADSGTDRGLLIRTQLMASKLMGEPGW
jgi:hypothetical protein